MTIIDIMNTDLLPLIWGLGILGGLYILGVVTVGLLISMSGPSAEQRRKELSGE
jgi:hypothetical protein